MNLDLVLIPDLISNKYWDVLLKFLPIFIYQTIKSNLGDVIMIYVIITEILIYI